MTIQLTPQQHEAALLLSQGKSYEEVEKILTLMPGTMPDWRKSPAFTSLVSRKIQARNKAALDQLTALVKSASETYEEVIKDSEVKPETRLRAAKEILKMSHFLN